MRQKVDEYNIIRVVATILVVLGHCDFLSSHGFSVIGMISSDIPLYRIFENTIRLWIYSFHMPLFMILSGALYSLIKEKYDIKQYVMNRGKRLLIPYFVCGTLYAFPIRFLCGYFWNDSICEAYVKAVLTAWLPGHLWFLWALFVISISIAIFRIAINQMNINGKIALGGYSVINRTIFCNSAG